MSRRHREPRDVVAERSLRKEERLAEHRRMRRSARQIIALQGDEAVISDGPAHLHAHRSEKLIAPEAARRSRRHWKQPFWKRRTNMRMMKAQALRRTVEDL